MRSARSKDAAQSPAPGASARNERLRRRLGAAWRIGLVALIAGLGIYRLRLAPLRVAGTIAVTGPIVSEAMGTGTLEARVQASISPKISGLITRVLVDQGDVVTNGQVLAVLDDDDLRQQVRVAQAEQDAVQAGVERAAADIASAEAVVTQTRATHARGVELARAKVISTEDLDQHTQQRDVAEANLRRARAARVELERQVMRAAEWLRYHEARLADACVRSPFDGLVVRRSREQGDVVVPGSEIVRVVSTAPLWVSAWVDEASMGSIATGLPARVVFRSDPTRSVSGTVARVAPLADRETREFLVDVSVAALPRRWAIGQRAEAYIRTGSREHALLAPSRGLAWRQGRPGLFVDRNGRAEWRLVALGLRGGESVEILEGLSEGERVIWPLDAKSALEDRRAVSRP